MEPFLTVACLFVIIWLFANLRACPSVDGSFLHRRWRRRHVAHCRERVKLPGSDLRFLSNGFGVFIIPSSTIDMVVSSIVNFCDDTFVLKVDVTRIQKQNPRLWLRKEVGIHSTAHLGQLLPRGRYILMLENFDNNNSDEMANFVLWLASESCNSDNFIAILCVRCEQYATTPCQWSDKIKIAVPFP